MEEEVILTSIDIDTSKAVQDAQSLKQTIQLLNKEIIAAREKGGETSAEYIKLSSSLKIVQGEYNTQTRLIGKIVEAQTTEAGTIKQVKAELAAVTIEWNKSRKVSGENSEATQKLTARKLELTNILKDEEKATGDNTRNVGNYKTALEGLPRPLGNVGNGVKTLSKTFKALLANPIVLIIAAIVGALYGLVKAFTSTDKGATEMAARMEQVRAIIDVVRQRAIQLIGVLKSIFSGDFKKAGEQLKETFTGIGAQMNEAAKAAYNYKIALDQIEDSQNNFISRSAEIRNQIAKLEFTAQDRTRTTAERKKALEEAIALSEEEVAVTKKINKAKLDEEAKYLAEKSGLRADDVIEFIRMSDDEQENASQAVKDLRNNNEEKFKDIEQLYAAWLDADTKFYEENKRNVSKYSGFIKELQQDQAEAQLELQKKSAEDAVQVMRDELNLFLEVAKQKSVIQGEVNNEIASLNETFRANELEAEMINNENENAILEQTLFGQLELERVALEQQEAQEIAHAEKIGARTTLIEKKYSAAKKAIATAEQNAKLTLAQGFADNVATIAGKQTAVGKAAAIASTLISTYMSATGAFASFTAPPVAGPFSVPLGLAAAAAAVASGLANVKQILSVKSGLPGEGSVSVSGGGGGGGGSASVPSAIATVNPEIGAGIVSRDTAAITQAAEVPATTPVLVTDEVTAKQGTQSAQQQTAVI